MIDAKEYIKRSRGERRQHLKLDDPCVERGGNSTTFKGLLAEYLGTTIPSGRILLCHACNNSGCSNPDHLYWGTDYDNAVLDRIEAGNFATVWDNAVTKYGVDEARGMNSRRMKGNDHGKNNRGKSKTVEHRAALSKSLKGMRRGKYKDGRKSNAGRKPNVSFEETYRVWSEMGVTQGAIFFGISEDTFRHRYYRARSRLYTGSDNINTAGDSVDVNK